MNSRMPMHATWTKAAGRGVIALTICLLSPSVWAGVIFTNSHSYAFGGDPTAIVIDVTVSDNYLGDFSKYLWEYKVTNNSYDPVPNTTNGFSGFETALPLNVADLGDQYGPANWGFNCCSGQEVEWDIRNSEGLGVMPGEMGVFGFTSLPRLITTSTGWFHTWTNDGQTDLVYYPAGDGPEVPDVLSPPTTVPEPASVLLTGLGMLGLGFIRRRRRA